MTDELPMDNKDMNDDLDLPLRERVLNSKWKIRIQAYKEINELFYNEYTKICNQKKDGIMRNEQDDEEEKVFEVYGPLL